MLQIFERLGTNCQLTEYKKLTLSHTQREKGRLRTMTSDGEEAQLFLPRGTPLLIGEFLRSQCGTHVLVDGAIEPVATVSCNDWQQFSKACYHLGNRHTKVEIGDQWLRILPDHVLEQMLIQLGCSIQHEERVFTPESGAYSHGKH